MQQQDHTSYIERVVYQQHNYWSRTFVLLHAHYNTLAFHSQTAHFAILAATSSRQAPPPTQTSCHPAATNCDTSIYISTALLPTAEHSRLTIDSPRVASLQHIFSKLASESEALRFNLRGPHPQIHTCVDPTTHAASPARAPHQRHDHHLQTAQNIRPR